MRDRGQTDPKTPEALFRAVVRPLQDFFRLEAASGILLLCSAALAMAWANSPLRDSYTAIFDAQLTLGVGESQVHFTVHRLINDVLMAIFFFVVGMEIKRELIVGELRSLSRALLPLVAAIGGMVVPAAIYAVLNRGGPGLVGWAIPMATDIAFCIGCLSLLKGRVPHALVVFLTALAIFDDMGGILVIAFFYGSGLHVSWLLGALAVTGGLFAINRLRVGNGLAYAVGGTALWYTLHHGGIHATIAGVILGMMIPARAARPSQEVLTELHAHTTRLVREPREEELGDAELLAIEERLEELEPPLNRFVPAAPLRGLPDHAAVRPGELGRPTVWSWVGGADESHLAGRGPGALSGQAAWHLPLYGAGGAPSPGADPGWRLSREALRGGDDCGHWLHGGALHREAGLPGAAPARSSEDRNPAWISCFWGGGLPHPAAECTREWEAPG